MSRDSNPGALPGLLQTCVRSSQPWESSAGPSQGLPVQECVSSHFESSSLLGPAWVSIFILTALGFGAPLIVGLCSGARHRAWAKKTQSGDSQVAEKEGPEDKRMVVLCTAPLVSSQILWGLLLVDPAR